LRVLAGPKRQQLGIEVLYSIDEKEGRTKIEKNEPSHCWRKRWRLEEKRREKEEERKISSYQLVFVFTAGH
jgi:hypothetical protein